MNATCELRPFVYNLLHFGSITASKATLKGQVNEIKLHYLRNILADQNIDVNCYDFPIEKQLELVRYFTIGEFTKIANIRNGYLITAFKETDPEKIKKRISTAISKLRKYTYPHKYRESYVKSYAYRMIFEVLEKKSRIYKETPSKKCKLISFVDGGYPFTFWKEELIKQKETDGVFLPNTISINGLSNGDEYFPMINIAGTIATILNFVPKANYPHNILEVPEVTKDIKTKFYQNFTEKYEKPTFYPRILFFGHIDRDLQYTLPYVLYRKTHEKLYEPFRVRGSFKSFYKAFNHT